MAAGSIVIDLLMKTGSFETDTKRAEKRLKEFKKEAAAIGTAIGAAVATGAAALTALTVQAINFADQINDMSQKVGVSTETLSGWGYAAGQAGTDLEALNTSLPRLAKNIAAAADESSRQSELFRALGIDVKDAAGNLRSIEGVLPEIADRFKTLNNETTEAALAQELFGRGGANMLQFLNEGSAGIQAMTERAAELGVVISDDTAQAAGEFNDRLDDLKALAMSFGLTLAQELLPDLNQLIEHFTNASTEGNKLQETAQGLADFLRGLATVAHVVSSAFEIVGTGIATVLAQAHAAIKFLSGDFREGVELWRAAGEGFDAEIDEAFNRGGGTTNPRLGKDFQDVRASVEVTPEKSQREKELEARINVLLAGNNKSSGRKSAGSKKTGPSEEEKAWLAWTEEMADIEQVWADAATDSFFAQQAKQEAIEDSLASLDEELMLLTMTAEQQEIYNRQKWAGVEADSAAGIAIAEKVKQLNEQAAALEDQIGAMDALRDAGADAFADWASGAKSFGDAAMDALDSLKNRLLQMIAENLMEKLFGERGETGGGQWGEAIGSFFGSIFGGAKAGGGDVLGGRAYMVGEDGPETFVPRTAGTVLTADQTANVMGGRRGSFSQTLNVTIAGRPDKRTPEQIARAAGRESARSMARTGR